MLTELFPQPGWQLDAMFLVQALMATASPMIIEAQGEPCQGSGTCRAFAHQRLHCSFFCVH